MYPCYGLLATNYDIPNYVYDWWYILIDGLVLLSGHSNKQITSFLGGKSQKINAKVPLKRESNGVGIIFIPWSYWTYFVEDNDGKLFKVTARFVEPKY